MDLDFGLIPTAVTLAIIAYVAARFVRAPARANPLIDEAVERLIRGEAAVRLETGAWGAEARWVSETNAGLAQLESGTFDWASPAGQQNPLFRALRETGHVGVTSTFVAIAEVDRFAALRRNIGYQLANQMLVALARRIGDALETSEVGRIGRTTIEFGFRAPSASAAQIALFKAVEALEDRLIVDGFIFDPAITIGFVDAAGSSIRDELLDQASAALLAAQNERVKICYASPELLAQNSHADFDLLRELPTALKLNQISLHYQPKLDARSNRIASAEALFRWVHPQRGLIPTESFVRLCEETGMIRDLTEWVITRAVEDQSLFFSDGHDIEIFVNISGQLLADAEFAKAALSLVGECKRIGFEITETAVIGDPEAALANLTAFSCAGIRIAIDDYGSGLSSLAYLKQLPADELKIDRLFVSGLTESHRDPLIIRSSIDLAHALDMQVTAEGVDDAMALSLLRVMGCDLLQGYFISPPLPTESFREYLSDEGQLDRFNPPTENLDWRVFGANLG